MTAGARTAARIDGRTVRAQASPGAYTAIDLGIAKYHFEVGAGTENFAWE